MDETWPKPSGDPVRDSLTRAIVSLTGTHGYAATTVEAVCGLAEIPYSEFARRFIDKEDCYLAAYNEIAAELGELVLPVYKAHQAWHEKVWAAGWAAVGFLQEDPVRARFFAVEVNGAGARAQAHRDRVMQVFVDLVDGGRAELDEPDSISRATAEIIVGSISSAVRSKILDGGIDRGEDFVDLVYMAMLPYFGARAAEAELQVQPLRKAQ